jgi:hypothetical protein
MSPHPQREAPNTHELPAPTREPRDQTADIHYPDAEAPAPNTKPNPKTEPNAKAETETKTDPESGTKGEGEVEGVAESDPLTSVAPYRLLSLE